MRHAVNKPTAWLVLVTFTSVFTVQGVELSYASHLGSSTASAGSAPSPAASAIQSFQPDVFTGRATTGIPIYVPPGRKNVQPSVGLSYSSSGRNSWVGVGWSLDLGYIEVSTKHGVPKYDGSDTFAFMFGGVNAELVRIPDGTYRAEEEGAFLRFTNNGVGGWVVQDKSGTRYFFGRDVNSQIIDNVRVFRWCLDQVIDTNGNSLIISYTKDGNQLYPNRIDYTGNERTGDAPRNAVTFTLEPRPDVETSYRSGFEVRTAQRLKEIATFAQGQLARKYVLAYSPSPRTGRSLLSGVTQYGTDGTTGLPPTTFTYTSAEPTYSWCSNTANAGSPAWNVQTYSLDTGHDNNLSCEQSMAIASQGSTFMGMSGSSGPDSWSSGSDGSFVFNGGQDHFVRAWTYVYVGSARTLSINGDNHGCAAVSNSSTNFQIVSPYSIPLTSGWNIIHFSAYHQHEGFTLRITSPVKSLVDLMNPTNFIQPQLAGDFNGDGTTDIAAFDPNPGSWTVGTSNACPFRPSVTWLGSFGNTNTIPLLGDWNSDGKTDVATYNGGSWSFGTSTGAAFQANTIPGLSFGSGTPLTGDFNGDGMVDLGTFDNGTWTVALSTGSGFTPAGSFGMTYGNGAHDPLTGDFNGDGLTDIGVIEKSLGNASVAFSNGSSFVPQPTNWVNGFGANQSHTSADLNGDGLTDLLYYDKPNGAVQYAVSTGTAFAPPATLNLGQAFGLRGSDDNLQVGDFGGDGMSDPAVFNPFTGAGEIAHSQGVAPDLLTAINNGLNGTTTVSYLPSTRLDNTGGDGLPALPFVTHVVERVTVADGLGHDDATSYSYDGGLFDAGTKEFRGFAHVTVRPPTGLVQETFFHQDEDRKGRPYRQMTKDGSGNVYVQTDSMWDSVEPYPGVHFCRLTQTDATLLDGDATARRTQSRVTYDDTTGNVIRADELGEVDAAGNDLDPTDNRSSATSYTYNVTDWILNKVSLTQTLDAGGAVKAQRRFYYDGATDTTSQPTVGNLTKEEEWLSPPGRWVATSLTYDGYGNVATVTDALGRTTTNTYDAVVHLFLTRVTNVAGHTRQMTYDPVLGQVLTSTDPNGVTATTRYDALGRVVKVVGPNDTDALPTTRYDYDLSVFPLKTTACARVQSGQPFEVCTMSFADGLGRTMQTRSPAEDPAKQVVTGDVILNSAGQVTDQYLSYLDAAATLYRPPDPTAGLKTVRYVYDAVGRTAQVIDPDGATTTTTYDDWSVTVTDANGHQARRASDAFGRLIQVEEFNQGQTYTTAYTYDTLNNLVNVRDQVGNVTAISYDSLSRKVAMDDPDMGHWAYAYDDVDNLTSQTDARGVIITFAYDVLNRLRQKTAEIPAPPGSPESFQEASGQVVMEAENYTAKVPRNGQDWTLRTTTAGYSGSGYLQALPNSGVNNHTGYTTLSPELQHQLNVATPGTYYVWLRGRAPSASDDSVHAGLDGVATPSADLMCCWSNSWAWKRSTIDNVPATVQVSTPGVHTFHLWMREDGFMVDQILLTTNATSTAPAGTLVESLRRAMGTTTTLATYTYDNPLKAFSLGKLTEITDGSGSSSFEYDNLGRLLREAKTVDGTTYTIQRAYDLLGRLTTLTYPDSDAATYTYNVQGGIETIALDSPVTGHLSLVTNVDYNAAGQLTQLAYGNGTVSDYTYDPQTLRLSSLVTSHSSLGTTLQNFAYSFDPVGNVRAITDAVHSATQTFQYDDLNRLTQATGAYGLASYQYDPIGNMLQKEGLTMTYGLPNGTKPHAVTATSLNGSMVYDANGNLLQKSGHPNPQAAALTTQFLTYDAENRLTEVKTAQDDAVSVHFDPGWNFFSLPVIPNDGAVVALLPNFAQDFEQIAKFEPATSTYRHHVGNPKFDDFAELAYGEGYEVYCKNPSGVTVTLRGKLPTVTLDQSLATGWHLLPAISSQPSAISQNFAGIDYDQVLAYDTTSGSLTTATDAVPGQSYFVHARTASTWRPPLPRDPTTRFVYDGDGGRVKQITSAGTTLFLGQSYEIAPDGKRTKYLFAGSQRIAAIETPPAQAAVASPRSSRWARWWRPLTGLVALLFEVPSAEAAVVSPTIRFYHGDHLGSANLVTDAAGQPVELLEYTPYGSTSRYQDFQNPANRTPQTAHRFTGQRNDDATGLYFYNARYYDPTLGRFTSPDPLVQAPADPQTLNRYSYVRNNPIVFVDPSGYSFWSKLFGAIAAIFVGFFTGFNPYLMAAVFSFTDTLISASQAGVSFSTALALASVNAAFAAGGVAAFGAVGIPGLTAVGTLNGLADAAILGQPLGQGAALGAAGGAIGGTLGLIPGVGPIVGSAVASGVVSSLASGDFWAGVKEGVYGAGAGLAMQAASNAAASAKLQQNIESGETDPAALITALNDQTVPDQVKGTIAREVSKTNPVQPSRAVGPAKATPQPDRSLYVDLNVTGAATGILGPGGTAGGIIGKRGFLYYGVGLGIGKGASLTLSLGAPSRGIGLSVTGSGGFRGFGVKLSINYGQGGLSTRIGVGVGIGFGVSLTGKQIFQIYGEQ
ncbi:MAG: VCBS repeat-containing protein [Candidatus Omnitrophica bacterium]|nr:VCBS repeat-containing protein [Candidatus Omnitrophota bacterium]